MMMSMEVLLPSLAALCSGARFFRWSSLRRQSARRHMACEARVFHLQEGPDQGPMPDQEALRSEALCSEALMEEALMQIVCPWPRMRERW
jgi:hypothetical protein